MAHDGCPVEGVCPYHQSHGRCADDCPWNELDEEDEETLQDGVGLEERDCRNCYYHYSYSEFRDGKWHEEICCRQMEDCTGFSYIPFARYTIKDPKRQAEKCPWFKPYSQITLPDGGDPKPPVKGRHCFLCVYCDYDGVEIHCQMEQVVKVKAKTGDKCPYYTPPF